MPILGEGRVVRHLPVEAEPTEPAVTLRAGIFGQHCGLSTQASQSCLLARYSNVAPSFTRVPVEVSTAHSARALLYIGAVKSPILERNVFRIGEVFAL
jgi:hypothetical protein